MPAAAGEGGGGGASREARSRVVRGGLDDAAADAVTSAVARMRARRSRKSENEVEEEVEAGDEGERRRRGRGLLIGIANSVLFRACCSFSLCFLAFPTKRANDASVSDRLAGGRE